MPHIFVTGGTGLVGSAIVRRLVADGAMVSVLARGEAGNLPEGVRRVRADLSGDFEATLHKLADVDAVVHAAAEVRDAGDAASLKNLAAANVDGSDRLFRWCGECGVPRVVFIGSLSVLRRPLSDPIDESHPLGPAAPYAMSKLWGEEALARRAKEFGFSATTLRISSPIPSQFDALPKTVVRIWIEAAARGEPLKVFGSGNRTQDFVACNDVAEAVRLALASPNATGVVHIGSGAPLSMRELAQAIAAIRGTAVVPGGDDPADADRWRLSLDRAARLLGYAPTKTGLQAILDVARQVL